jgi:hypothetical protein
VRDSRAVFRNPPSSDAFSVIELVWRTPVMTKRFSIAALGFLLLGACSPAPATMVSGTDTPVPGAASPARMATAETANQSQAPTAAINSDNKPVATRSGLNSDPANPNGAPGSPSR